MEISSTKEDGFYLIHIEGDLDASTCINLDNAISEASKKNENKLLIDCSDLNYLSSAGLGVFMSYLQEFEKSNIAMVLYGLNDKVRKVFEILGLHELIKMVNTKEEAKSLVNESQN